MADSNLKDFLGALNDFKSNMQDFNRTRIIQQANEKVQQIRASDEAEAKKRMALQNVSNELVGFLAGDNTPATTIQEVVKAFGQPAGTPAQEISQAVMTGNQAQLDAAKQAALETRGVGEGKAEEFRSKLFQQQADLQLELAGKRATSRSAEKKILPVGEAEKVMSFDEEQITGQDILTNFLKNRRLVGVQNRSNVFQMARELKDPEFAAFKAQLGQWFDQYRVRVTGAGASPGELKILEKNRPSVGDEPSIFEAKVKKVLEVGQKLKKKKLQSLDKLGYNVQGLMEESQPALQTEDPGIPPGFPPGTVPVTINGVVGAGFRFPDGRIVKKKKKGN